MVLSRLQLLVPLLAVAACRPATPDTAAPAPWFTPGELIPAFEHANAIWAGVAMLDYDGDGWLDLYFTNGLNHPDALYRNQGDGTFQDVTAAAGLGSLLENGSVVAGDLDNDGDPDMVLAGACSTGTINPDNNLSLYDGHKRVLRNNGDGTFTTELVPIDSPILTLCTTGMTLADLDQDGWLDLVVSNSDDADFAPPWGLRKGAGVNANLLLYNDGAGNLTRVVGAPRDGEHPYTTFTTVVMDLTDDGRPDLLYGEGGWYVHVMTQDSEGAFHYNPARSETGHGLWMGMAVADYDLDGDLDVYATNQGLSTLIAGFDNFTDLDLESGEFVNLYHAVLANEGGVLVPEAWPVTADHPLAGDGFAGIDGGYLDLTAPEGLDRMPWGWGAVSLDADADSLPDVAFVGNNCSPPLMIIHDEPHGAGPGALLLNDGAGGFRDVTWEAGIANLDEQGRYPDGRGIATGDLNNDGYADLVFANRSYNPSETSSLTQQPGIPLIWLSTPRDHAWLRVRPVGDAGSNRDGIGAVVRVSWDDETRVHLLGGGGETSSSSERVLTLGVGDADLVDVEVEFPSGRTVRVEGVTPRQELVVRESDA
ncbi:MAG: CRTAC1 family protein [Alphaproteobacteria bacterium]|nr:CRTAC1 family protein [Alphaproteobacteria bacterium]